MVRSVISFVSERVCVCVYRRFRNTGIAFNRFLVLLFFGGKKIPEPMKGMGRGIRSFKKGMNGREKEKTDFWPGKREAN